MTFVYIVIGIAISCIFGTVTKSMNEEKGYEGGFAWGFWLGLIGIIVVAVKPYRPTTNSERSGYADSSRTDYRYPPQTGERSQIWRDSSTQDNGADSVYRPKPTGWTCLCGVQNTGSTCFRCRRTRDEGDTSRLVVCPHCGAKNNPSRETCFACNAPLKTPAAAPQVRLAKEPQPAVSGEVQDKGWREHLLELKELYDLGILTAEEYASAKEKILEKMLG